MIMEGTGFSPHGVAEVSFRVFPYPDLAPEPLLTQIEVRIVEGLAVRRSLVCFFS